MVARSVDDRIKDVDARIAAMELAREQDMAKMEEKYARRKAELQAKKTELDARKRGDTTMGSKDERVAFMRVLEAKGGFGFNYAQALAVLKQVSEGSNMDNTERLAALGDEGRALMQPRMPKRSPQVEDMQQAGAATAGPEGGAGANEEHPTAPAPAQEGDATVIADDAAGAPEGGSPSSATLAAAWGSREKPPCVLLVDENHGESAAVGEGTEWDDDPLPRSSGDTATGYERSSVEQGEWA